MEFVHAAIGLIILLLAGDALVRGAVNIALRLQIPALVVSLTIVSFGTSAPELFISAGAVLDGAPDIALGNVVGSNIANILLVLGLPALISGIDTGISGTGRSYLFMKAATAGFIALCFLGDLSWIHGLLLLSFLAVVTFDQIREARIHQRISAEESDDIKGADPSMSWVRIAVLMALGLIGLPFGASLLIDGAISIAGIFGVSEAAIGLTLVAAGTSLPELATTFIAAIRRHSDVVLGNVIGSNIFNLLAIIGFSSFLGTIPIEPSFLRFNLWVMLAASLALAPFALAGYRISRMTGAVLVTLYLAYVAIVLV